MKHLLALVCCLLVAAPRARATDNPEGPLDTAAKILSLTDELAGRRLPVSVHGVVTAAERDWGGQFFVQDASGGVFVENLSGAQPAPGDEVIVEGVSHPGAFAPILSAPRWKKLGQGALPAATAVLIEDLESGVHDGLRVEIVGVVRTATREAARLTVYTAVGGYRVQVSAPLDAAVDTASLIGARIRVRGTAATHYNAPLRHLVGVGLYAPSASDFEVLERERLDPFAQPVVPLKRVAQYRRGSGPAIRVHVRGRVTHRGIGNTLFLQDDTGGLGIEAVHLGSFALGEEVDAVGFLEYEGHLPLLRDGVFKTAGQALAPVAARRVPVEELHQGLHHGSLITLSGKIIDRSTRPKGPVKDEVTTWLVQGPGLGFTVEYESESEDPALAAVPLGSTVEVEGVCLSAVDSDNKLMSVRLLLPSPSGFRVLAKPSWLTPERLFIGLLFVGVLLFVSVLWLLTIARKNSTLKRLIAELERAQDALQEAHDTLEQKVIERSAQLKEEMTARKTAEVQFKAVLAERTRLAGDLHDTLEQALTGIALQLDTTVKLFTDEHARAEHHLQLARHWLRQSQIQLRHSIWDLRSRELEQFDLAEALRQSAERLVDGTDLRLKFEVTGEKRPLPEVVEENVLRIGQEAITNIAKHARATLMTLTLRFSPESVCLTVIDDGVGFDRKAAVGAAEHHYGLVGMEERARRVQGRVDIQSVPGRGTSVSVEIALPPGRGEPSKSVSTLS